MEKLDEILNEFDMGIISVLEAKQQIQNLYKQMGRTIFPFEDRPFIYTIKGEETWAFPKWYEEMCEYKGGEAKALEKLMGKYYRALNLLETGDELNGLEKQNKKHINTLGHDDESEIYTLIVRMREGKFKINTIKKSIIYFSILLTYSHTVPVPSHHTQEIQYFIENNDYNFMFGQIGGKGPRILERVDGFTIWTLLEEK